ncbi:MAG: sodium:solute symporter family protein [Clostridia bacterium]|jgi:SSS family solute:Na+ symporter|nr:sodium:solute symporter family protein [Clostridia bacterium]
MLTSTHLLFAFLTLAAVTAIGIYSMKHIHSAADFALGGRSAGTALLIGAIAGTIAGGAATIGTAQMAFQYGLSAWWFTLGAGISCIILGLFLAKPLRESGMTTGPAFLGQVYGGQAQAFASIFSSVGMFLNIIGNVLSGVALLTSIFGLPPFTAACIAIILIISYVVFGGVWGAGYVGLFKLTLIYTALLITGLLAYSMGGGLAGFRAALPPQPFFSPFGRGVGTDLAAGFSLLVGIFSTQTYLQAIFSAKDIRVARKAALISGVITPPIGFAGILAGMYMRIHFPDIPANEALPLFILNFLPGWLGGITLATLLISLVGTAAGLVLGISTMLTHDIFKRLIYPQATDRQVLTFSKAAIVAVAAVALVFAGSNINSVILKWSILSMGLRGATICLPLLFAIFCKDFVRPRAGLAAIILAPLTTIFWAAFGSPAIDPLYPGMLVSLAALVAGSLGQQKRVGSS